MYLSRVRVDLNGLARGALFAVMNSEPYGAHQLLWRLFPDYSGPRPFLFRQEQEECNDGREAPKGLPLFYVLSEREPVAISGLLDVESKVFAPLLRAGDRLSFRLRANPTLSRRVADAKRSPRSDVLMHAKSMFPAGERTSAACVAAMDAAARHWLVGRGGNAGFELHGDPVVGGYRQHALEKAPRRPPIQFSSVDYEGFLEVTDADVFNAMLLQGLGRSKAFGCGLMLIRRA